ncbi:uncharacterized protein B0I36DRAFT_340471 [Microdochium trichocladiopsis]|uniref:Uncharacterized protein n=1 Tax=Microdochium trichocladiopsis TaxID=1682393 RepID=A0A9P8XQN5_9PEZI|nr:uncharacterized protein B0I36DRAFT_340471 [Microdochium trichocladiopsis]KAH7012057.1 hypothetical protein B0I36DRAFT_340471 [Microdochium trichocladiopsis]
MLRSTVLVDLDGSVSAAKKDIRSLWNFFGTQPPWTFGVNRGSYLELQAVNKDSLLKGLTEAWKNDLRSRIELCGEMQCLRPPQQFPQPIYHSPAPPPLPHLVPGRYGSTAGVHGHGMVVTSYAPYPPIPRRLSML